MQKLEVSLSGVFSGHKGSVYGLAAGDEKGKFYSCSGDGLVVEWDAEKPDGEGKVIARLPVPAYCIYSAANSNHSADRNDCRNFLFAGGRQGVVYAVDRREHKLAGDARLTGDVYDMLPVNGSLIAAATGGGELAFLSWPAMEIVEIKKPSDQNCRELCLIEGGKKLATGWSDKMVRIYDTSGLEEVLAFEGNGVSVFALAISRWKNELITGGRDARLRVFAMPDFEEIREIPAHLYTINDIAVQPAGKLFATASRDKSIKIWDPDTYDLLKVIDKPKLDAHSHSVNKVIWLDDETLVSGSDDKSIRAWKIKEA